MDWEGKIVASHLTCSTNGRHLLPGDVFFSALVMKDGQFQRLDFSPEAWATQDQHTFLSWWRQKVPQAGNERKAFKLNAATLAQIFANLKDARTRSQQCLAYVVALALVRARKLQFIEVRNDQNQQVLVVQDRAAGVVHRIRDPQLAADEEAHVLHNLLELTSGGEPDSD
jgi:hypothetical protein